MRVASLAFTVAFLTISPAAAQCVYVACNSGGSAAATFQHQENGASGRSATAQDYDAGYAAGLATRPFAARHVARTKAPKAKTPQQQPVQRVTSNTAARQPAAHARATPIVKRRAPIAVHTVISRPRPHHRVAAAVSDRHATQQPRHYSTHFHDSIKDRATSYRAPLYGQSASFTAMTSSASSYASNYSASSSSSWSSPTAFITQGSQLCGWSTGPYSHYQGHAQRQTVWVCQYAHGWRPPGY